MKKQSKKNVYFCTALDDFKPKNKKECKSYPFSQLKRDHRELIIDRYTTHISSRTKEEELLCSTLHNLKIRYEEQAFFRVDKKDYYLDFYLPDLYVAIEVDGNSHKENKEYDKIRDENFKKLGIRTIRFANSYVRMKDFPDLLKRILRAKPSSIYYHLYLGF